MWCSFKNMATDGERSYGVGGRRSQPIFLCLAALAGLSGFAAPAAATPWTRFELAASGSASINGNIARVSRIPNSMEIWWIAADGSVQGAYYYDGGQWQRYTLAPAGSARVNYGVPGGITAVSRISSHMEVWWVGADGSVQGAYYYDGGQWTRYTLSPAGTAGGLGNGITAMSRVPGSMEVWWIGPDGSVQDAYWYDGNPWKQFELAPAGSAAGIAGEELGVGGITAVSRVPGSMEVWWIGPDGSVQDAYWYDGNPWQRFQLAPPGSAAASGGIAAVSRHPSSMEIWWVGPDGSIQDAFWNDDQFVPETLTFYSGWITTDQPLGGWANLVVSADGYFTFSGHMHDSGFDNIDYDAVGVLVLPSGLAFALHHHGHCDGTQTLIDRQRDDDWTDSATFNDFIRSHWAEMGQAKWVVQVKATDDLFGGIEDWFDTLAQDILDNLDKEAALAVVALIL
jgi:hypothetical protein